ncbi:MAG: ABC transporter permease subunit, partial [Acidobacteria bacterium]|nr:ABC transporter permease subunit [Acidobacteriota bacterium]
STLGAAAGGFALAIATAVPLWLWMAHSRRALAYIASLARGAGRFPMALAAPVFVLWFGFGNRSAAAAAWWFALFPLLAGSLRGVRSLPAEMLDWMTIAGAGPARWLTKVYIPATIPFLVGQLDVAFALALSGALTAEFLGADRGLGYLLMAGVSRSDIPLFGAALSLAILIAALACYLIHWLQRIPAISMNEPGSPHGASPYEADARRGTR